MIAILMLVVIMFLSLLVTRVATTILMHTGMSADNARFQARSAWTNSGYTTSRSECMVNHPIRRRVLMVLMLLGNVGLATTSAAFIVGMAEESNHFLNAFLKFFSLVGGIMLLLYLGKSRYFANVLNVLFDRIMIKFLRMTKPGFHYLCHLSDDYKLLEIEIMPGHRLAGKPLSELQSNNSGITLLELINLDGSIDLAPEMNREISPGMKLIIFGRDQQISTMLENAPRHKGRKP